MRTDNQARRNNLETKLSNFLDSAIKNGTIEVINGQIHRAWVTKNIGCGQNWINQNETAKKTIQDIETKLREKGKLNLPNVTPGGNDKDYKLMQARISRLEQRNAQLNEENNLYRNKLYEYGWMDSDDDESQQGRLPW